LAKQKIDKPTTTCDICGKGVKGLRGLQGHMRFAHDSNLGQIKNAIGKKGEDSKSNRNGGNLQDMFERIDDIAERRERLTSRLKHKVISQETFDMMIGALQLEEDRFRSDCEIVLRRKGDWKPDFWERWFGSGKFVQVGTCNLELGSAQKFDDGKVFVVVDFNQLRGGDGALFCAKKFNDDWVVANIDGSILFDEDHEPYVLKEYDDWT